MASFVLLAIVAAVLITRSFTAEKAGVRVSPVTREPLISTVSTNGKVEPVEYYPAHATGSGVVQRVYVEVGDHVKAGDPLISMTDADARQRLAATIAALSVAEGNHSDVQTNGSPQERLAAAANLTRDQQQQQQATKSLAALQELESHGAASAAEVTAAQDRLTAANNALHLTEQQNRDRYNDNDRNRTTAQLNDGRAAVAAARANLASLDITAPFAGTVYSVSVNPYDFVNGGETLLDLADLNRIQVRAYFDEPEIGHLNKGQAVTIIWEGRPGQTWHGHIERAPSTVMTYGTRNVGECIINVDDARGDLLPNTNVTVTVTTSQRFNALTVPREAVHTENGVNFVYRVVNNRLVRTTVQVGVFNVTREEIATGLSEKDTVALSATDGRDLANGLEVKPVE